MANTSQRQGAQGTFDEAPKVVLAAEFDTEDGDEVIKKILKEGSVQVVDVRVSSHVESPFL